MCELIYKLSTVLANALTSDTYGYSLDFATERRSQLRHLDPNALHLRPLGLDGVADSQCDVLQDVRGDAHLSCHQLIDVEVVYEDEYILAVNKPRGMPTHPSKGNHLPTLANAVMGKYGGNFVFRAINRLDRDTSGIVLIAKDPFSAARLSEYMREHHLDKRYLAKLKGVPKKKHGIIEANIEREYEGSIKRVVRDDGKYAKTEYTVLEDNGDSSVCGIKLYTGRTHQIRVHMAYIGHPLVNDFLYGVNEEGECYKLHCSSITFLHPITNAPVTVTADCDFYK
jgi:23S rRNA pseudouridine1911/1915/1917 synthase